MFHKNTLLPREIPNVKLEHYDDTLVKLLLHKAHHYANSGKEYFAIDAVTREKRFFSKFEEETKKIASAFYKLGLRKGDVVIYMPNEMIKLHIFILGVWRANGVCRASYPEDDSATIKQRIEESNCKFILCDKNTIETCKEAVKTLPWLVEIITTEKQDELKSLQQFLDEDDGTACPDLEICSEDNALIMCTSGTTGPSKGAVYTHAQLVFGINMLSLMPFTELKPNCLLSKATHITGTFLTFAILNSGKTSIVSGQVSAEIIRKAVHELKPGFAFSFPTFLLALVGDKVESFDFSSLEILWSGGTLITSTMREKLLQLPNVKDFIIGYGLTECINCTTSATLSLQPVTEKSDRNLPDYSIGKTFPETYIQIRDVETLQVMGPHQLGEICVKSLGVFKEYYENSEATKQAFVEGFFRTGDVGYYDQHGYIYIKDRIKEIFKYYNNHISPSELENVIGKHPNVKEVCVVGVPDPEGGGDIPRAFITVKESSSQGIAEDVKRFYDDQVPDYKQLRGGLYIVAELPKGKSGKVTRNLVAKLTLPA